MEIFRPLIGFVLGLAVMAGAYVGGLLDRIPHRSRDFTHWSGGEPDIGQDQARYRISATFESSGDAGDDADDTCPPRFEFHNHTNRQFAFSADGYDDASYNGPPAQGYVSTTPEQEGAGPPPRDASYGNAQHDYGQQGYDDRRGYDRQSGRDRSYDDESYDSGQQYGSSAQYDTYDDEYPGESQGGCSAGVVQVYLDRNK